MEEGQTHPTTVEVGPDDSKLGYHDQGFLGFITLMTGTQIGYLAIFSPESDASDVPGGEDSLQHRLVCLGCFKPPPFK